MQGHDGKPPTECVYKETKNESDLVTLQAEREDTKSFLGLYMWQDREKPLCTLPSCWANRATDTNGLANSRTWWYKGEFFSSASRINACFLPLEEGRTGILEICPWSNAAVCTVRYTRPVTAGSGFCVMATKLLWLLPVIQWWSMMIN